MVDIRVMVEPLFFDGTYEVPQSAKHLDINRVHIDKAIELNNMWHSMLPNAEKSNLIRVKTNAFYAASYDGIYYAVGLWSSPVSRSLDDNIYLELRRLAICENSPKFTATRMISKMVNDIKLTMPHIKHLISYQDTNRHNGTIYAASNWYVDNFTRFTEWNKSRERKVQLATGDKIRWRYDIVRKDKSVKEISNGI